MEVMAHGRMAHSAYPELGESAIDKLLLALQRLSAMKLPAEAGIGPCTLNIGVIEGGRAPNVIPDKARAQLLYRLVGPAEQLKRARLLKLSAIWQKLNSCSKFPSCGCARSTALPPWWPPSPPTFPLSAIGDSLC